MNARFRTITFLAAMAFAVPALAAPKEDAVAKPVKTVVQSVRYERDALALKHFGSEEQGKYLLGDAWAKGTDAQRKEFVQLFQDLFAAIAFPRVRENFKNLDSITYEPAQVTGNEATIASTIFIKHPLKTQEMKLNYRLIKDAAAWKVVDVKVLGSSMLTDIRDSQVQPLLKQGGWDLLLARMRTELAKVQKK
ncbi:ABC transporter substrate-binding protein [Pyxidicoccus fallax]|uniref:ABC transporter substrate-binding protein n=1 Tax=Pyxidicoccus fallax TaxID=394095 RepID=A0A848LRF7_9BACT|nr:ABC transporter substrate-binding protein [Pyxidicoccus fallax]NMO20346.1 ABC transporter substrate-binding protein [Pyxidicoccus fallax]NPC81104.1 ABC transporter substrate-binding protein [Pyxidicoccus fallax]